MIDLNNIGNGRKLIKQVMKTDKISKALWNKSNQVKQLKNQKNPHNTQSRLLKK